VARATPVQTNFTAGELSPRLYGREDVQRYSAGLAVLDNFHVLPHGGVHRREGSVFVGEVINSAKVSRLINFEHDVNTAYILEFGNLKMAVFKDRGQVQSGGADYQLTTEFVEANLFDLQHAQSADIMYLTSKDYWPRKLSRTADDAWTITEVAFVDGPYLTQNTTAITMTPGGTTGSISLTASSAYFNSGMAPTGTERGMLFRILDSTWGYMECTGFTSTTVITCTVLETLGGTNAVTTWREGAWSSYRGFPRALTFYEERLYFGGTSFQPQTVWGSAVAAYEDHTPGVADDDPVNYTIASRQNNTIQWMHGRDLLFIGTSGTEYRAGDATLPLTPTNVRIVPQTSHGSDYKQPLEVQNILLFQTRSRRQIREFSFDFREESYRASDITLLAEHITSPGIKQTAYANSPDEQVFAVREDGMLLVCTFDREQEVVAWGTLTAGADDAGAGVVESVAVIPTMASSGTEGYDEVWTIVKRNIDGSVKRFVEYFKVRFTDATQDIEDAYFVDCGLTYSGGSATTLSGLDHLDGEVVTILGDGAVQTSKTVASGSITLDSAVTKASVGLPYTSTLKTLPGIYGAREGSAQSKAKSWGRVRIRLHETVGLTIAGETIPFRSTADDMDTAIPLFSGWREAQIEGWDDDAQLEITQTLPLPATILVIVGTQSVGDI
jgi:hypothetical protein